MLSLLLSLALQTTPIVETVARLPEPVTNNAVAGAEVDGVPMAYSFAGLHAGKTWRDVTADAYACDLDALACREIAGLPDGVGRLASVAVNVRGWIYIFGGYTVAEDGSERSTPEVWRFDPSTEPYELATEIPTPVDDAVALVLEDRYVYLVSGWHDVDNVDLVQVYDVRKNVWFEATPFPGRPVFGHAGGVNDRRFVICGGTAVFPPAEAGGRRSFGAVPDCWAGVVAEDAPAEIAWSRAADYPGGPFYRGVAIGDGQAFMLSGVLFIGGTTNAFNYNGVGYDGEPSEPRGDIASFLEALVSDWSEDGACGPLPVYDFESVWSTRYDVSLPVMDNRGVVEFGGRLYLLGGMGPNQKVSDGVVRLYEEVIRFTSRDFCLGED
jgi:hypothetical protein